MPSRTSWPLFIVLVLTGPSQGVAAVLGQQRPLAVSDLYALERMPLAVLAPTGDGAVAVRQWIDPRTKQERSSLWLVRNSRDKREALEAEEPDGRAPTFSSDGKWIAFLSPCGHTFAIMHIAGPLRHHKSFAPGDLGVSGASAPAFTCSRK